MRAGAIELVLTVMTLWTFGMHLSRALRFSTIGIAALYVVPGVVGALVSVNLSTGVPSVGAPAAVCGLIGESASPYMCMQSVCTTDVHATLMLMCTDAWATRCCHRCFVR